MILLSAEEIIQAEIENAGEWLEMNEDPNGLLSKILANRMAGMLQYIDYLEKKINKSSSIFQ